MFAAIRNYWNSLPHQVQAGIMLFGGAAAAIVKHSFADTNGCLTTECIKGYCYAAIHGGVAAVVALYIPSNFGKS